METSQAQHGDRLQPNRDEAANAPALTLREITNRGSKHLHDQLERAGSGSLQRRDSNSAAPGPDAHDSAGRDPVPQQEPPGHHELNVADLNKAAAAEQNPGKHGQIHGEPQAPLPDSVPQRPKPSPPSKSAASSPDAHDSADRLPPCHDPFIVVNFAELRKIEASQKAKQDSGKHLRSDGPRQSPLPASRPQRTKPSPQALSLPVQAGHHAHAKHAQTSATVQGPAGHSSRNELHPAWDRNTAAAPAATQLVGMHRQAATGSDQKAEQHNSSLAALSKLSNSRSAAHLHCNGDVKPDAGAGAAAAVVRPLGPRPYVANRAFQPPLSADPDNIAAWDTPRLEQLPAKLPEPRSTAHLGAAALDCADPACKAGSAYDSPRAAQARGGEGVVVEESADGTWPAHVMVVCNSNVGKFLLVKQTMVCTCKLCQNKAAKMGVPFVDMTPTEFERHSGS